MQYWVSFEQTSTPLNLSHAPLPRFIFSPYITFVICTIDSLDLLQVMIGVGDGVGYVVRCVRPRDHWARGSILFVRESNDDCKGISCIHLF